MKTLPRPSLLLALIAGLCLIALTIPAYRWLDAERANVGAIPRAIDKQADLTRKWMVSKDGPITKLNNQVGELRVDVFAELGDIRKAADARTGQALAIVDRRTGDALAAVKQTLTTADNRLDSIQKQAGEGLGIIRELKGDLKPVFVNSAALLKTYTALPDRLAVQLGPSWEKLQPEITCKLPDGSGYGRCWHSQLTGLMGEALNVGGVFTKNFPSMVATFQKTNESMAAVALNFKKITDAFYEFLHPPPVHGFWPRVRQILKGLKGLLEAALRGGVF